MKKKIAVIGSGFAGIAAAAYAAKDGHEVHVLEKNDRIGGRARQFVTDNGYTFDMGPSWYWMPDVIESFFTDFGCQAKDFYQLVSLDPQFEMVFDDGVMAIPSSYEELRILFDQIELGAGKQLDRFMQRAKYKYEVGMQGFVRKPCHSWWEFVSPKIALSAIKLDLLTNFSAYVRKYFSNPKLIALMEFPVIFLGAAPRDIPALYSLMNYGGYRLGTWYPMGGFAEVVHAMAKVAKAQGVKFHVNSNVEQIQAQNGRVQSLVVNGESIGFDAVIAASDYHHTESLLKPSYKNYDEQYWDSRTFAPSCLIYYLGFNERIPDLRHHTLFFEHDLELHINDIYTTKKWPEKPLFYACCPSKTDAGLAPDGHENVFLLMPVATGIVDTEEIRERYFLEMIGRLEKHTGSHDLLSKVDYKRSYCVRDFVKDYNAFRGNAYGLANTLKQTAVWKPAIRNKKIKNLYYTGQLTVPGPGVPPSIISGKIVAGEVNKLNMQRDEKVI